MELTNIFARKNEVSGGLAGDISYLMKIW